MTNTMKTVKRIVAILILLSTSCSLLGGMYFLLGDPFWEGVLVMVLVFSALTVLLGALSVLKWAWEQLD